MRRTIFLVLFLVVPPTIAAVGAHYTRLPKRYAEIEPGRLSRGAFPTAAQIRNMAEESRLRTIVNLNDDRPTDERERGESAAAAELRIGMLRFPMPGDGRADFETLSAAASAVGDQGRWPLFFHCAAGKMRSNAVTAAYRMKCCGWTADQAIDELRQTYWMDSSDGNDRALAEHLRNFEHWLKSPSSRTAADNID